jgi:hypothetical protein
MQKSQTVPCGNKYCDNQEAKVDGVCGKFVTATDENCDYINYVSPKCLYSLDLVFLSRHVPDKLKEQILEFEEIIVDLRGLKSIKDATAFLLEAPETEEYGESMSNFIATLLMSWGTTFGPPSDLNPDPNEIDGPKFSSIELTLQGDELRLALVIEMHLSSHQFDMLEWYPDSLAESLMDEEDFVWTHEGHRIVLNEVVT